MCCRTMNAFQRAVAVILLISMVVFLQCSAIIPPTLEKSNLDHASQSNTNINNNHDVPSDFVELPSVLVLNGVTIKLAEYFNYNPTVDRIKFNSNAHTNVDGTIFQSMLPLYDPALYIDRPFEIVFDDTESGAMTSRDSFDTPALIESNFRRINKQFVVIYGGPVSGKTVSLLKIHENMRKFTSEMWTVTVPLYYENPETYLNPDWTPSDIFKRLFDPLVHKIFTTLLEKNPSKINILIDNIHTIPTSKIQEFINYFTDLNKKGVGLVMTSLKDLSILEQTNNLAIRRIPKITPSEKALYFEKNWREIFPEASENLIQDYAQVVATKLSEHEGNIPQSFVELKVISSELIRDDINNISPRIYYGIVTLGEYIDGGVSNPGKIMKSLETIKLDKNLLFKKFVRSLVANGHVNIEQGDLTVNALRKVLRADSRMLSEPEVEVFLQTWNIEERCGHLLDYFENLHPEYINFFAANRILHRIRAVDHTSAFLETFRMLLENGNHVKLLEYINRPLLLPGRVPKRTLASFLSRWYTAMDTAIVHGLDNIAHYLFQSITSSTPIGSLHYFSPDAEGDYFQVESNARFSFGLRTNTEEPVKSSRLGMLLRQNMRQTIAVVRGLEMRNNIQILTDTDSVLKYLEDFPTLPNPSLQSLHNACKLIKHLPDAKEIYNTLLFNIVRHRQSDTVEFAENLISVQGVEPENIRVDGLSLLEIAAKTSDASLLNFLIRYEPYSFNLLNSESVFISALDASPLQQYSPPEFWRTMEILIKVYKYNLRIPQPTNPAIHNNPVTPTAEDKKSVVYKLLAATEDIETAKEVVSKLKMSPDMVEELSPGLREFRRNLILSRKGDIWQETDRTCITEVILKYRGLDDLSPDERKSFESSVNLALNCDIEFGPLSPYQVERIRDNLRDNLGTPQDLWFAKQFSKQLTSSRVDRSSYWDEVWKMRSKSGSETMDKLPLAIETGVLPTRKDFHTRLLYPSTSATTEVDEVEEFSLLKSDSNAFLTQAEHEELVKVLKRDGKELLMVDVDKFMEKMTAARVVSENKYQEYRKLGKQLIAIEGVVLDGRLTEKFERSMRSVRNQEGINLEEAGVPGFTSQRENPYSAIQRFGDSGISEPSTIMQGHASVNLGREMPMMPQSEFGGIHQPVEISVPHTFEIPAREFISVPRLNLEPRINVEPVQYHGIPPHSTIPEMPTLPKLPSLPRYFGRG